MAEPVEVAIEKALLDSAIAFAESQSPALTIALPNVEFTPPVSTKSAKWLEAHFLPAPTAGLGINVNSTNQHYGILQINAFYGAGAGGRVSRRLVSAIIAWFKLGTVVSQDGFTAKVWKPPYAEHSFKDGAWFFVPVSIHYVAYAANPA